MSVTVDGKIVDAAIASLAPGSPLIGKGDAFHKFASDNDVDWRFLVAIAYQESKLGTYGPSQHIRNPFGLGPGMRFDSWSESIKKAAEVIHGYGVTTVAEVGAKWAPVGAANDPQNKNANWVRNVSDVLVRLGGNPGDITAPASGIATIPGDVADLVGGVTDAVTTPLELLRDLVARLIDPAWWIRVGMVVGGVLSLGLGIVLIGRSVTDTGEA